MEIKILRNSKYPLSLFEYNTGFALDGSKVGVFRGWVKLWEEEVNLIKKTIQISYEGRKKNEENFFERLEPYSGISRDDLVVDYSIEKIKIRNHEIDITLKINGFWQHETNADGPGCLPADASLKYGASANHPLVEKLKKIQPDASCRFAYWLEKFYGTDKRYYFIPGQSPVPQEWGPALCKALKSHGVNIKLLKPERFLIEKIPKESIIIRYGDTRQGPSSPGMTYPKKVVDLLYKYHQQGTTVLNTLPNFSSPGHKGLLIPIPGKRNFNSLLGENFVLNPEYDLERILGNKANFVLKPGEGGSGKRINFLFQMKEKEKRRCLEQALETGEYVLQEFIPHSPIKIPALKLEFVFDLCPSYFVHKNKVNLAYVISRITNLNHYQKTWKINVSQGGGFAGTVIDANLEKNFY